MIDGQFVLHCNNYDLEEGERSCWDQELAGPQARSFAEPQAKPRQPGSKRKQKQTHNESAPKPARVISAGEKARLANNQSIENGARALDGARRHFFWKHRNAFKPFGALIEAPRASIDSPGEDFSAPFAQPSYVQADLRDYQLEGLRFLAQSYANGVSAILGDEMGLGKTLQTISFLAWLKFDMLVSGPHLVIAPLSVLSSWMSEFKRFCPQLKIVKLHSSDKEERERLKEVIKEGEYDVVVTTCRYRERGRFPSLY